MIPAAFEYVRPDSLAAAIAALAEPDARPIAGGHSLVPVLKLRQARPGTLVDIARLPGLRGVSRDPDGRTRIGALTTYNQLLAVDPRDAVLPEALRAAAEAVNDWQVRNAGTVGGALVHGDPRMDVPTALLALEAEVVVHGPDGARTLTAAELQSAPFASALGAQELLGSILVPAATPGEASAYVSIRDPAAGFAYAGAAARVRPDGERLAVTGGLRRVAGRSLEELTIEAEDDWRLELAHVVARRALAAARAQPSS